MIADTGQCTQTLAAASKPLAQGKSDAQQVFGAAARKGLLARSNEFCRLLSAFGAHERDFRGSRGFATCHFH